MDRTPHQRCRAPRQRGWAMPAMAGMLATAALGLAAAPEAGAQQPPLRARPAPGAEHSVVPLRAPAVGTPPVPAAAPPAADAVRPERLRDHLRSIHGFSREGLDAASLDAPRLLREWAADPAEPMFLRRQAVKALRLYPDEATLTFLRAHLPTAPEPLQPLYLLTLRAFAASHPGQVAELAGTMLDGSRAMVTRHAAVSVLGGMAGSARAREILRERLRGEADPSLRRAMHKSLRAE